MLFVLCDSTSRESQLLSKSHYKTDNGNILILRRLLIVCNTPLSSFHRDETLGNLYMDEAQIQFDAEQYQDALSSASWNPSARTTLEPVRLALLLWLWS